MKVRLTGALVKIRTENFPGKITERHHYINLLDMLKQTI
jgi:hypothetical protein